MVAPASPLPPSLPAPDGVEASPDAILWRTSGPRDADGNSVGEFRAAVHPDAEGRPLVAFEAVEMGEDGRLVVASSISIRAEAAPHLAAALWLASCALNVDPFVPSDPPTP